MRSHLYKYLVVFFLGAVTTISSMAWSFGGDQSQSKSDPKVSQTNISDQKDDRVRFIPDNLFTVDFVTSHMDGQLDIMELF